MDAYGHKHLPPPAEMRLATLEPQDPSSELRVVSMSRTVHDTRYASPDADTVTGGTVRQSGPCILRSASASADQVSCPATGVTVTVSNILYT
ncbi:hypothetical protein EVG20_g11136 [Dentipellis fragilis]|uniref:Uncharacterized protein n=1 Tax=Dentipellis fragilis TaxID=205917 RepID=A0A4Y9XP67_9AGAM|nr:hypothetical protein EVG20_g11136 [Dentipellis fragilis]